MEITIGVRDLGARGSRMRSFFGLQKWGLAFRPAQNPLRLSAAIFSLIIIFFTSCSTSSVLIKPDDQVFNQSQQRFERTIALIDKMKPPLAERALFLQAESFYRYRFEPLKKSKMSFFAEAAASITDFPAFQSLAGSLNLLDLRVRASDSAIQIWETFLKRYPQSSLRPLTLYRLGWAYRNVAATGLPRENPNQAFDELINEEPTSSLAELAKESENIPWKSKSTAAKRSLIPGLGQMYVGETKSGIIRLGVAVASVAAILVPIYIASHRDSKLTLKHDWPLLATGLGGLIVLSFDYTSSYEDSMRGVVDWNERAEDSFNSVHTEAP